MLRACNNIAAGNSASPPHDGSNDKAQFYELSETKNN